MALRFSILAFVCLLCLSKSALSQTVLSACTFEDGTCNYDVNVWSVVEWSDESIVPEPNQPGDHYLEIRPGDEGANVISEAEVRIPFTLAGSGSVDLDVFVQSRPTGPGAFYLLQGEDQILYMWEADTTGWTAFTVNLQDTGDNYLEIYIPSGEASKLEVIAIDNIVVIELDDSDTTTTAIADTTTTLADTTTTIADTTTTIADTTTTIADTTTTIADTTTTIADTTTTIADTTTTLADTTTTLADTTTTLAYSTTTTPVADTTTTTAFADTTTTTPVADTTTTAAGSTTTSGPITLSCDFEEDFCSWIDVYGGFERVTYGSVVPFPEPTSGMWFLVNYVVDVEAEIELNLPCSTGTISFKYFLSAANGLETTNSNLLVFRNVDRSTIALSGGLANDGWTELSLVLEESEDNQIGFSSLVLNDGEVAGLDDVNVTLNCNGQSLVYKLF